MAYGKMDVANFLELPKKEIPSSKKIQPQRKKRKKK